MTKDEAALALCHESYARRRTTAGAKRVVRACKVLGLTEAGTLDVLKALEFAKSDGEPWGGTEKVWTVPAQLPTNTTSRTKAATA